ncbi:hypothetical protein H2248_005593 [Termitomyces sp. 'cryptogamus']|nr:hypothetical protein H2248_005593 [Termitomyces sp. 'cryptogamus']
MFRTRRQQTDLKVLAAILVSPLTLTYKICLTILVFIIILAHGTSTLKRLFRSTSIRSVYSAVFYFHQTNSDHLEATSGSAGLAKLLPIIVRQATTRQWNHDTTMIDSVSVPWHPAPNGSLRITMLNNFGAARYSLLSLVNDQVNDHQKPVIDSDLGLTQDTWTFSRTLEHPVLQISNTS